MKKNLLIVTLVFAAIFACITISNTLAKYSSLVDVNANLAIADWLVKVNGTDITTKGEDDNNKRYDITEISWNDIDTDNYEVDVEDGYIAPGKAGSFGITIDASECDVAVDYEVYMDFTEIETYIQNNIGKSFESSDSTFKLVGVYLVRDGYADTLLTKDTNDKYTGSILLNDLITPVKLRADIVWNLGSDDPNASSSIFDSLLGSDTNNILSVPVTVTVKQKIGAGS